MGVAVLMRTGASPATAPLRRGRRALAAAGLLALAACGPEAPPPPLPEAPAGGWHEFRGSWNATGSRRALAFGERRSVALLDLSGSLLLSGPSRPDVGYRGECLAFVDTAAGLTGRCVWTDERGERIFSLISGEGTATGNRIVGKFVGGTGRWGGAMGEYSFTWRYVVYTDEGTIQGRGGDLAGRIRVPTSAAAPEAKP